MYPIQFNINFVHNKKILCRCFDNLENTVVHKIEFHIFLIVQRHLPFFSKVMGKHNKYCHTSTTLIPKRWDAMYNINKTECSYLTIPFEIYSVENTGNININALPGFLYFCSFCCPCPIKHG